MFGRAPAAAALGRALRDGRRWGAAGTYGTETRSRLERMRLGLRLAVCGRPGSVSTASSPPLDVLFSDSVPFWRNANARATWTPTPVPPAGAWTRICATCGVG